jgi:hypothetical protein
MRPSIQLPPVRSSRTLECLVGGSVLLILGLQAAQEPTAWELATPAPAIALRPAAVPETGTHECAECHAEVVAEWASTAHAIAWIDELYQAELRDRKRPELCHGCHAPEPLLLEAEPSRPKARETDRHLGVSCNACHLGHDGTLLGLRGTPTEAHASAESPFFAGEEGSRACAACHSTNIGPVVGIAKDFFSSDQSSRGRSCAGCHMATVERGTGADGKPRLVRSHAIQTPRDPGFLRRAFELKLEVREGKAVVVIANRAGHRVPGLIGREIRFAVHAAGGAGAALAEHALDARRYLPVDGEIVIELPEAAGAVGAVRVVATHVYPRAETPVPFLDLELEQ